MKKTTCYLLMPTLFLAACQSSMFYGDTRAPVVQQNTFYSSNIEELGSKSANNSSTSADNTYQSSMSQQVATEEQAINVDNVNLDQPSPYGDSAGNSSSDGWGINPSNAENPTTSDLNTPLRPATRVNDTATSQPSNSAPTATTTSAVNNSQHVVSQPTNSTPTKPANTPATSKGNTSTASSYISQASSALGKGDLDGAVNYLQEAQRVDSNNAKIAYDIANIRIHQGKYQEAEAAAGRAVQIGGSNEMLSKAWGIIANARKNLGDNQGAISAAEKAASY